MPKTVYNHTDLLFIAEELKLDSWNGTIDRMQNSGFYDGMQDSGSYTHIDAYEVEHEEDPVLKEIFRVFLERNNIESAYFDQN